MTVREPIEQPDIARFSARLHPDSTLGDYWHAPSGNGNLANTWQDKPYRLLYDLIGEVLSLRAELAVLKVEK